ncbi:MAG: 50S ribosomal protein L22, partial [Akkermansiaceae bacterium]
SLDTSTLVIKQAVIGAGPTLRRFMPRAKGSAGAILKRSSHISITLVGAAPEKKKRAPKKAAAKKSDAPATEETAAATEAATA